MVSTFIGLLDIQSWWEIPCIAHFCSLFSSAFRLPDIDIEDLEAALLTDGTDDTVGLLPILIVRLLQGCDELKNRNEITVSNYQMFLRRYLRQQCRIHNIENHFDTDIDFQSLPVRNKLLILNSLCHFRLDSKDVQHILSNLEADSLRVEPLGYDTKNSGFWYFYGTRLYREDTKGKGVKNNKIWQVICFTEEDWQNLAEKFKSSTSAKERALYNIIVENFLPKLPDLFRERERLRRRKLFQVRNSARIRNLVYEKHRNTEEETEAIAAARQTSKSRTRRRSISSSIASGISTYASSIKASSNTSASFCNELEKSCLTTDFVTHHHSSRSYSCADNNDDSAGAESLPEAADKSKCNYRRQRDIAHRCPESDNTEGSVKHEENKENNQVLQQQFEMAPANTSKLPGRQTNNSLSSLTGNIFIPTVAPSEGSSSKSSRRESKKSKVRKAAASITSLKNETFIKKKKLKPNELSASNSPPASIVPLSFTETDEVLQIGMHKVLVYVKNHRDAWPFMDPVEEDIAPRYYTIIRRPMDLLKIEEKLDNGEYAKFGDFRNDFKLIVNNCRLYNGQNNEYTEMVNNLQDAFDRAQKKYFDQNSSDEEPTMEFPESKINVFREKYFNKKPSTQDTPKEQTTKRNKDKEKSISEVVLNVDKDKLYDEDMEKEESLQRKRRRKDKDKRRKKKSKSKSSDDVTDAEKEGSHSTQLEPVIDSEEATVEILQKTSKKRHDKVKEMGISSSPEKKIKSKSNSKLSEKDTKYKRTTKASKELNKSETDEETVLGNRTKVEKNHKKSKKKSKLSAPDPGEDELVTDDDKQSEKDFSSDNSLIDYPICKDTKTRKLSRDKKGKNSRISVDSQCTKSSNDKMKQEKENRKQNTKSKNNRQEKEKNEPSANAKCSANDNKKQPQKKRTRKTKSKETVDKSLVSPPPAELFDENDDEDGSRSSTPLYKVDLHKKYAAASASIFDNDDHIPSAKSLTSETQKTKEKDVWKDNKNNCDYASNSRSRSASPSRLQESQVPKSDKPPSSNNNKSTNQQPESPSVPSVQELESKFPLFMDKYDLIKQRRNRNTEDKWNQIVKEAEKIKDNKKNVEPKENPVLPPKNQTLKETIEKLKAKNATSKERSVLIDEIFGVKLSQEVRDERTIFEKLREACGDQISTADQPNSSNAEQTPKDEYAFEEDVPPSKQEKQEKKKEVKTSVKRQGKAKSSAKAKNKSTDKSSKNKTNLEALELETEQTLKDINRWLEHTPRFAEFSSASNSPLRYNLLDDFDAVATKLDPADFRRPVPISSSKEITASKLKEALEEAADTKKEQTSVIPVLSVEELKSNKGNETPIPLLVTAPIVAKPKETPNTTQLIPHPPPPPPHVKSQLQKEKRKSLKEKLSGVHRRKDLLRTIDRLQPGKSKGNLISNIHNVNKPEELFPLGAAAKIKEVKNSLVVKTDEAGPKLSLGSVLQTDGFGLGQLHNFSDNISSCESTKVSDTNDTSEGESEKKRDNSEPARLESLLTQSLDAETKITDKSNGQISEHKFSETKKDEKQSATPNLSAWFKAFGAPKKIKKCEEDEKKQECTEISSGSKKEDVPGNNNPFECMQSPSQTDNFFLPAPRQRKPSTGSTISERSSFSQDPDSPRVGIDDRFGAYAGPYASPLGASPIMISPKPEEATKPTSPYPLNGAIKVGFYQDTTTKSSPEKSCSPRELPSPYPQYSQHLYSTNASSTINPDLTSSSYTNCYNPNSSIVAANKTTNYSTSSPANLFEQYKQPHSHESDYNSSMSPGTNPSSPYQQPQNSPYQTPLSPYQQNPNSPYQQPQTSPFQSQPNISVPLHINAQAHSPATQTASTMVQQTTTVKTTHAPPSPYQQQVSSPYQQPANSPYQQQNSNSPYEHQQQTPVAFVPPPQNTQQQQQSSSELQGPKLDQSTAQAQFVSQTQQQYNQSYQQTNYEQEISERASHNNKLASGPSEWQGHPEMNVLSSTQRNQTHNAINVANVSEHSSAVHQAENIDHIPMQHQGQVQINKPIYPNYTSCDSSAEIKEVLKSSRNTYAHQTAVNMMQQNVAQSQLVDLDQKSHMLQSLKRPHEPEMVNMGYSESESKVKKTESPMASQQQHQLQQKTYDTTLNKQQQMFESFVGSMASKNIGFGKPLDISTSKAFEMFNRAATMGFPKEFPTSLISANKPDQQQASANEGSHLSQQSLATSYTNANPPAAKPLDMASENFSQSMQVRQSVANTSDVNKLQQTQQQVQNLGFSTNLPQNASMQHQTQQQSIQEKIPGNHMPMSDRRSLHMDLSTAYKSTYNNPSAMLEPLRSSLNHSLSMMDDSMLGNMQTTTADYYDKTMPPAAHLFNKSIGQQMFQNTSAYSMAREQQNTATNYAATQAVTSINPVVSQQPDVIEPKISKRGKKKKNNTQAAMELATSTAAHQNNQNAAMQNQQQQLAMQQHNPAALNQQSMQGPHQGFQLYAGLKTSTNSAATNTDGSAISLKSAASMVPGSAFNFGPAPTGLGLPTGIYSDGSGYLDDFRASAANPYYMPPAHRSTPEGGGEKSTNTVPTATTAPNPYQFLTHTPTRSTYPFMNAPQLDPNSAIYQQYLRQQEDMRARMMINQGLLGSGTAPGYAQTGYRPPMGIPKPYDMNQPWF